MRPDPAERAGADDPVLVDPLTFGTTRAAGRPVWTSASDADGEAGALGDADGVGDGDALGEGDGEAVGEGDGEAVGSTVGDGVAVVPDPGSGVRKSRPAMTSTPTATPATRPKRMESRGHMGREGSSTSGWGRLRKAAATMPIP